jgi:flagellar basal-body rod modification protein FlgD
MIDTTNVTSSTSVTGSTSTVSSSTDITEVTKDDFFKLLIAQLRYQDPLNPQDGSEYTAQLAQFTSLEKLSNIYDLLETQGTGYKYLTSLQSVSLVGKEVEASIIDEETSESTTITGTVSSVQFKDDAVYLTVGDQEISFADVISVK